MFSKKPLDSFGDVHVLFYQSLQIHCISNNHDLWSFKLQLTLVQSAGGGSAYLDVSAVLKMLICGLRKHSFQAKTQQFQCLTTMTNRIYIYKH